MARQRMVTRTVTENTINAMVFNLETNNLDTVVFAIGGEALDETSANDICEKRFKNSLSYKFIKVNSVHVSEKLYGMPEEEFIRLAKVLPPR